VIDISSYSCYVSVDCYCKRYSCMWIWCMDVMILSVWCVFSKLLRPSWISKYVWNCVTVGCKPYWLFCHRRHRIPVGENLITTNSFSNPTYTKGSSKVDHTIRRRWPRPLNRQFIRPCNSDVHLNINMIDIKETERALHTVWSLCNVTVIMTIT
jgi:hypothetical protein